MVWFNLLPLVMFLVDPITIMRYTNHDKDDKDAEILLLRRRLRLLQRKPPRLPRLAR